MSGTRGGSGAGLIGILLMIVLWKGWEAFGWWGVIVPCVAVCVAQFLFERLTTPRGGAQRPPPTESEVRLRRASRPVGVAVVGFAAIRFFDARLPVDALAAFARHPSDYWVVAVLLACIAAYGVAAFVGGFFTCANPHDGTMGRAMFVTAAAGAICLYLWTLSPARLPGWLPFAGYLHWVALLLALWFTTIGGTRTLLLVIVGDPTKRLIKRLMRKRNAPMRPANPKRGRWRRFE